MNHTNIPFLDSETRKKILETAISVYDSYRLLDLLSNATLQASEKNALGFVDTMGATITATTQNSHQKIRLQGYIELAEDRFYIDMVPSSYTDASDYTIKLVPIAEPSAEYMNRWGTLTICVNGEIKPSLSVNIKKHESIRLAGPEKVRLFPQHLDTLSTIIELLKNESSPTAWLAAMPTNSGKSFIQALWFLILRLSEVDGIFSVPNGQLAEQLQNDFLRLLPDHLVQDLKNVKTSNADTDSDEMSRWIITTHQICLKQYWKHFYPRKKLRFFIFDEADKAVYEELFSKRVSELVAHYPVFFLGATPPESIYKKTALITGLTGKAAPNVQYTHTQDLISQTNQRTGLQLPAVLHSLLFMLGAIFYPKLSKLLSTVLVEPLQALFPKSEFHMQHMMIPSIKSAIAWITIEILLKIIDLIKFSATSITINILVVTPLQRLAQKLLGLQMTQLEFLRLCAANIHRLFQPQYNTAAHTYVDTLYTTWLYRAIPTLKGTSSSLELLNAIRWTIHSPVTDTALIITDETESVENICLAWKGKSEVSLNGKQFPRYTLYDSYRLGDLFDAPYNQTYVSTQRYLRIKNFYQCIAQNYPQASSEAILALLEHIDFSPTPRYLEYRVMHGIIDNALCFLVERDLIQLNSVRQENLDKLTQLVIVKVQSYDEQRLNQFLAQKKLTSELADKVKTQIQTVLNTLKKLSASASEHNDQLTIKRIVDNWPLDKKLHDLMQVGDPYAVLEALLSQPKTDESTLQYLKTTLKARTSLINLAIHNAIQKAQSNSPKSYDQTLSLISALLERGLDAEQYLLGSLKEFCKTYSTIFQSAQSAETLWGETIGKSDAQALHKMGLSTLVDGSQELVYGVHNPNLQHVALILSSSSFFSPSKCLQLLGRLRSQDPSKQSSGIIATTDKMPHWIANLLSSVSSNSEAFYKVLFEAERQYRQATAKAIGPDLIRKLLDYLARNEDKLNEQTTKLLEDSCYNILIEELINLYNKNKHDLSETREAFGTALKVLSYKLNHYESSIEQVGQLSIIYRVAYLIAHVISNIFFYLKVMFDWIALRILLLASRKQAYTPKKQYYIDIITSYNLRSALINSHVIQATVNIAFEHKENERKFNNFLKTPQYYKALSYIVGPLLRKEQSLLELLKMSYPGEDNQAKIAMIKAFLQDLETNVRSRHNLTTLYKIQKWVETINEGVQSTLAYYYRINKVLSTNSSYIPVLSDLPRSTWAHPILIIIDLNKLNLATLIARTLARAGFIQIINYIMPLDRNPIGFIRRSLSWLLFWPLYGVDYYVKLNVKHINNLSGFLFNYGLLPSFQKYDNQLRLIAEAEKIDFIKNNLLPMVTALQARILDPNDNNICPLNLDLALNPDTSQCNNISLMLR